MEEQRQKDVELMEEGLKVIKDYLSGEADDRETEEAGVRFLLNATDTEQALLYGHPLHMLHEAALHVQAQAMDDLTNALPNTVDQYASILGIHPRDNARAFGDALVEWIEEAPGRRASEGIGFLLHLWDVATTVHDRVCITLGVLTEVRDLWIETSDSPAAKATRQDIQDAMARAREQQEAEQIENERQSKNRWN